MANNDQIKTPPLTIEPNNPAKHRLAYLDNLKANKLF